MTESRIYHDDEYYFENGTRYVGPNDVTDEQIQELAESIFKDCEGYQYSDVYRFAKALLKMAKRR